MEKIDILALAFVIVIAIYSCYIAYLKTGINFLVEELAKHHVILEKMLENSEAQNKINAAQDEYNTIVRKLLNELIHGSSSTGGGKLSN